MLQPNYGNYDQHPVKELSIAGCKAYEGYANVISALKEPISFHMSSHAKCIVSLDYYPGVTKDTLKDIAMGLDPSHIIDMDQCAKSEEQLEKEFQEYITSDRVFGIICHKDISSLYEEEILNRLKKELESFDQGLIVIIGLGVNILTTPDIQIYAGLTRWEIQLRFRKGSCNFNRSNPDLPILAKYKRGFFIEWRIADRYKYEYMDSYDFFLDSENDKNIILVDKNTYQKALSIFVNEPFRMEPYFDPGIWGGHWMQEHFELDPEQKNFAWSFDGVPEENSIHVKINDTIVTFPALDVVYHDPIKLLGDRVHARFGKEFPIRFDMLDTIGGQNLSLQVHPLTEYIQEKFGMHYTQDESYYILDTGNEEDAYVYLGVQTDVDQRMFAEDLRESQLGNMSFPAEKYVNKVPVHTHDHVLIPAGTVHCSGKDVMVLEISATPYIFTFKLWDWDRLGLDGLPRPIHVEHGLKNIQWNRDTQFVYDHLIHQEQTIDKGTGYLIEKTGLHEREFIDTIRYSLSTPYTVTMDDSVHVMNLVAGSSCYIKSIHGEFDPFMIHFAETAIVPAGVGAYTIEPVQQDEQIKLIVASIRNK